VEFVVPTGNFGNVLAGWLAGRMGLPGVRFRVATNQNDILYRFFATGRYEQTDVHPSHAPSMDIQAASNFERYLYYLTGKNPERVRALMETMKQTGRADLSLLLTADIRATRMNDAGIGETIARVWRDHRYTVDPHTACGFAEMAEDRPSVVLATASPAKFPEVVMRATGTEPRDSSLEALKPRTLQTWPLPADPAALKEFIRGRLHP
jgi:threonine synthase